jgi:hypothetical protein
MEYYMSYENIPKNIAETAVLTEVTNIPRNGGDTAVAVQEVNPLDIPIEVSTTGNRGVAVYIQDQATDMLDLYFLQTKATGLTLAADTVIDSKTITLTAGHGLTTANSAEHILEIASTLSPRFYQSRIISIAGDVVTLSSLIPAIFLAASSVVGTGNPNMCKDAATGTVIDGSVTPVIFKLSPLPNQSGDFNRVIMASTSPKDGDLATFGGAPALTSGLLMRVKRADGTYKNLFNYRANFDLVIHGFDHVFLTPKAGSAVSGFVARVSFNGADKHGVVVRLDGNLAEELQIVVSELMVIGGSGNLTVSFIAEGSELQQA